MRHVDVLRKTDWPAQHRMIADVVMGYSNATKPIVVPLLGAEAEDDDET